MLSLILGFVGGTFAVGLFLWFVVWALKHDPTLDGEIDRMEGK